jgi:hypothetical protein
VTYQKLRHFILDRVMRKHHPYKRLRRGIRRTKVATGRRLFVDTFAIYYSREDKYWVAHSLRTDQFGTGDCVVDALVDGLKAVDQILALARKKPNIQIFCEAPEAVQEIAKNARKLPDEIFQIAHKRLYGKWAPNMTVTVDVDPIDTPFIRKVREPLFAHA